MSVTDNTSLPPADFVALGTEELDLNSPVSDEPEAIPERLLFGEYGGVVIVVSLLAVILVTCMLLPQ